MRRHGHVRRPVPTVRDTGPGTGVLGCVCAAQLRAASPLAHEELEGAGRCHSRRLLWQLRRAPCLVTVMMSVVTRLRLKRPAQQTGALVMALRVRRQCRPLHLS